MLKNYTKEYSVNIICLVTQLNIEVGLPGIETDLYLESQPEVMIATSFETTKELGGNQSPQRQEHILQGEHLELSFCVCIVCSYNKLLTVCK